MSRPVLIGVEIVDGAPDIGAGWRERFTKCGPRQWSVSKGGHSLTVTKLARVNGTLWFFGSGSKDILTALSHLGAKIKLVSDLTNPQKQTIRALGVKAVRRESDQSIVALLPPVVYAGQNPLAVALDGNMDPDETYTVID